MEDLEGLTMALCRFCNQELKHTFCDLGVSPLANSYLTAEQLNEREIFYPCTPMCARTACWSS